MARSTMSYDQMLNAITTIVAAGGIVTHDALLTALDQNGQGAAASIIQPLAQSGQLAVVWQRGEFNTPVLAYSLPGFNQEAAG